MITQKQYCDHSGLSKGQVSKLVARGMPLSSFVEADQWRGMTAKRRPIGSPVPGPNGAAGGGGGTPSMSPPPSGPPPGPNGAADSGGGGPTDPRLADTADGAYVRQRQIERFAFALAMNALRANQPDAGRLLQIHSTAASNLVRARDDVLALAEREGKLMSVDWVRKIIVEHDGAVVALAKAMPRLIAGRICPEDPERAEEELRRWVEEVFLHTLYSTSPWSGSKPDTKS